MKSDNNKVRVVGKIVSEFVFDHISHGEKFFTAIIMVNRLSKKSDLLPIIIPEKKLPEEDYSWRDVEIIGQFRSHNKWIDGKSKLILSIFVEEIYAVKINCENRTVNQIFLDGYVCKEPVYRITPLGRELTDIMLAVNRKNKTDYIPCIAWGENARYASEFLVGTHLQANGRIQSREYSKWILDEKEIRIAYEVSISQMEVVESEECKDQVADAE